MANTENSDFLIIGSGIAGLFLALKAAQKGKVIIITKKADRDSNTNRAQGGIAAVLSNTDSYESHISDSLKAGDGLCNKKIVELTVKEGPALIKELIDIGVNFTKEKHTKDVKLSLGKEGGHSHNRIVHSKDLTGKEIETALLIAVKNNINIKIFENHCSIELITQHHLKKSVNKSKFKKQCWGAFAYDIHANRVKKFLADYTILSTGGAGQIYQHTTNPDIATGDGIAMAYRAGAKLANLEFMQFHPTYFYSPNSTGFLISEAVRGFGGKLINRNGEYFMKNYHAAGSLATRDIVARAIDNEMKISGNTNVFIDITHLSAKKIRDRFPNIYKYCKNHKLDMTTDYIPVTPAAHYMCGGVVTNEHGQTSIKNLYACGEVACTGLHGANRLASNSLLEALVFANRTFNKISTFKSIKRNYNILDWNDTDTKRSSERILTAHNRREIREIMWDYVGIVRTKERLIRAKKRIKLLKDEIEAYYKTTKLTNDLIEIRNMVQVAELIIYSALKRKESRGLHYILDYPKKDPLNWNKDTIIQKRK